LFKRVPSVRKAKADPIIMMKDRLCPGTTPYSQSIQFPRC
jgi:hypothetical protein